MWEGEEVEIGCDDRDLPAHRDAPVKGLSSGDPVFIVGDPEGNCATAR
jgi:hypothetical protein